MSSGFAIVAATGNVGKSIGLERWKVLDEREQIAFSVTMVCVSGDLH